MVGMGRNKGPREEALCPYSSLLEQSFLSVYWAFSSVFLEKGSHQAFSKSAHWAPPQTNGMRTSEAEAQAPVVFYTSLVILMAKVRTTALEHQVKQGQ